MKNAILLTLVLALTFTVNFAAKYGSSSQFDTIYGTDDSGQYIKIMSFNTYWLFDCIDDPDVSMDQDRMPSGCQDSGNTSSAELLELSDELDESDYDWGSDARDKVAQTYEDRLKSIAHVINSHGPDVLALQEVENRQVLDDLNRFLMKNYAILHFDSMDSFTGQDLALLYNREILKESRPMSHNLSYSADLLDKDGNVLVANRTLSKGILETELEIIGTDIRLAFLVAHLKSQLGGFQADLKRIAQANTLRKKMDEIFNNYNKKIFVMGDMNDVNPSPVIEMLTGESAYHYDYDGSNQILFYDLLVDFDKENFGAKNFSYLHKKFLKAGAKHRYLGTFHTRIDYIFASPWVRSRSREAMIDQSFPLSTRKPSDHYPVVTKYYYHLNPVQEEDPAR